MQSFTYRIQQLNDPVLRQIEKDYANTCVPRETVIDAQTDETKISAIIQAAAVHEPPLPIVVVTNKMDVKKIGNILQQTQNKDHPPIVVLPTRKIDPDEAKKRSDEVKKYDCVLFSDVNLKEYSDTQTAIKDLEKERSDKLLHLISHAHSSLFSPSFVKIIQSHASVNEYDLYQFRQVNTQLKEVIRNTKIPLSMHTLMHKMSFELFDQFGKDLRNGIIFTKNNKAFSIKFAPDNNPEASISNTLQFIRWAKKLGFTDKEIYTTIYGFSQGGFPGDVGAFVSHQQKNGVENDKPITPHTTPLVINLDENEKARSIQFGVYTNQKGDATSTLVNTFVFSHTLDQPQKKEDEKKNTESINFSQGYTAPGLLDPNDLKFDLSIKFQAYQKEGEMKLPDEKYGDQISSPNIPDTKHHPILKQNVGWSLLGTITFAAILVIAAIWLWPIILGLSAIIVASDALATFVASISFGIICGITSIFPTLIEQRKLFSLKSYAWFFILSTLVCGALILFWPATLAVTALTILIGVSIALSALFNYFMRSWRKVSPIPPIFAIAATCNPSCVIPGVVESVAIGKGEKLSESELKSQPDHPFINLIRERIVVNILEMLLILNIKPNPAVNIDSDKTKKIERIKTKNIVTRLNLIVSLMNGIQEQDQKIKKAFEPLEKLQKDHKNEIEPMSDNLKTTLIQGTGNFANTYLTQNGINIYGDHNHLIQIATDEVNSSKDSLGLKNEISLQSATNTIRNILAQYAKNQPQPVIVFSSDGFTTAMLNSASITSASTTSGGSRNANVPDETHPHQQTGNWVTPTTETRESPPMASSAGSTTAAAAASVSNLSAEERKSARDSAQHAGLEPEATLDTNSIASTESSSEEEPHGYGPSSKSSRASSPSPRQSTDLTVPGQT